ncbi:hypothetical protein ABKV19_010894 [Rosa sericea]
MDRDWAELPEHLLDSILKRLELLSDYFQFSLVCWSWYWVAKDSESQRAKMMLSCYRPPLLLISRSTNQGINTWNVYNVMSNRVLDLELKVPNKRFCGSSKGWLIAMEKDFSLTLINPFFRVKGRRKKENSIIHLPPMTPPSKGLNRWVRDCEYYAYRATISADPILDASDCTVVVIYEELGELAFLRLGKDTRWTYVDKSFSLNHDVIYAQDKFYSVDGKNGDLLAFDVPTHVNSTTAKKKKVFSNVERVAPGVKLQQQMQNYIKKYIVESNGKELLMVQRYIDLVNDERITTKIEVFELDFHKCVWKEINTLGDLALSIGDNHSVAVLASHFPGCHPNCIYFNHDHDRITRHFDGAEHHDFGIYNVQDKRFYYVGYNEQDKIFSRIYSRHATTLLRKTNRPPMWVVPSFHQL